MLVNGVPIWIWMLMLFPFWWGMGLLILALFGDVVPSFRTPISHLLDGLEHLPERVPIPVADEIPYPSHHTDHRLPAITSWPPAPQPNWSGSESMRPRSGAATTVISGVDRTSKQLSAEVEHELAEVKHALRALDESGARGHEYSEEHQRLERIRESLLEELSRHQESQSKTA